MNSISSPFRRNDTVILSKGTVVRSTNPSKRSYVLTRAQRIIVRMSSPGYVMLDGGEDRGKVHLPTLTWAGTGGYWCDVQVTPELCEANDVGVPELPGQDGRIGHTALNVIPSYDEGYTNRWTV